MFKQIRNRADWSDKSVSQKGFTLIELLVVIAILGILAVVGVLSFGGLTNGAKASTAKTELTQVQTASDAYSALHPGLFATGVVMMQTDGELKVTNNGTATGGMQCNYTFSATGDVSFSATQVDPNCK